MLLDAARRWRSWKVTKRDLVVASTRHHRARLLKYYPIPPCTPSFAHFKLVFNKYSLSLYVNTRGMHKTEISGSQRNIIYVVKTKPFEGFTGDVSVLNIEYL